MNTINVSQRTGIWDGVIAGLIAGVVTILFSMQQATVAGYGTFFPEKLIAATLWGADALEGGTLAVLGGLSMHVTVAAFLGGLFGFLIRDKKSLPTLIFLGIAYGVVVWAIMSVLLLPLINPILLSAARQWRLWWFFDHIVFGGLLFITPFVGEFRMAKAPVPAENDVKQPHAEGLPSSLWGPNHPSDTPESKSRVHA